jgi:hypothetical protein
MIGEATNVTTGEVRLSYVHLFKPYAFKPGDEEKYSVTVLVPKTDAATKARIDAAIEAAKQKGITGKWNGQCPPIVPVPIYDGDGVRPSDGMPFGAECKGHWVFTASEKVDRPPEVVDAQGSPIINQSEIYSGIYAFVNVEFYPYLYGAKKGIGCSLGPVMKRRDGEPLGGSAPTAAQAFGTPAQPPQTPAYQTQTYGQAPQAYQAGPAPSAGINPITGLPY